MGPYCGNCFNLVGVAAKLKGDEATSHYFRVSAEPVIAQNVESVYRKSLSELSLSGPLLLCESVATLLALSSDREYNVIVVIVNRVCDDVAELRELLQKNESAASVLIVGVGTGSDFTRFASFPEFCMLKDMAKLLANVPSNVVKYFSKKGMTPQATAAATAAIDERTATELFSTLRQSRAAHLRNMENMRQSWKL